MFGRTVHGGAGNPLIGDNSPPGKDDEISYRRQRSTTIKDRARGHSRDNAAE
jgi:hypothetical protein